MIWAKTLEMWRALAVGAAANKQDFIRVQWHNLFEMSQILYICGISPHLLLDMSPRNYHASVYRLLTTLGTWFKHNYIVFLFCDWFISINVFKVPLCSAMSSVLFKVWGHSRVCLKHILHIHSSIHGPKSLPPFGSCEKCYLDTGWQLNRQQK